MRDADPAKHEISPRHERMRILSKAHARSFTAARCAEKRQILPVGQFLIHDAPLRKVRFMACRHVDRKVIRRKKPGLLRRLVCGKDALEAERLRRLHQKKAIPRERCACAVSHGIAHGDGCNAAPIFHCAAHRRIDHARRDEAARRIMDGNYALLRPVLPKRPERREHGRAARCAATCRNDARILRRKSIRFRTRFLGSCDHDHAGRAFTLQKGITAKAQRRFAAEGQREFVFPHARACARRKQHRIYVACRTHVIPPAGPRTWKTHPPSPHVPARKAHGRAYAFRP